MPNVRYTAKLISFVVQERFDELPKKAREWIIRDIKKKLEVDPFGYGEPLSKDRHGYYKLRVNIYRVIYRIDEKNKEVIITEIDYRRDIY
jgi:mRNA-degrading endonuclease RelE of RelBE toxin-antitoxin system